MSMFIRIYLLAFCAIFTVNATVAQAQTSVSEQYSVEARALYWQVNMDATIQGDSGSSLGSDIDLVEDLGIDEKKGFFGADATFRLAHDHKIRLSYVNISYDQSHVLKRDITFNGTVYTANTPVDSDFDVKMVKAAYDYTFLKWANGYLSGQLIANYLMADATLVTNSILSNSASGSIIEPMVGATGRIFIKTTLAATAEIAWIGYDNNNIFDGSIYLDYNPLNMVGFTIGYRGIRVDAKVDDEKYGLQWNGLFGGLIIRL